MPTRHQPDTHQNGRPMILDITKRNKMHHIHVGNAENAIIPRAINVHHGSSDRSRAKQLIFFDACITDSDGSLDGSSLWPEWFRRGKLLMVREAWSVGLTKSICGLLKPLGAY